MNLLSFVGVFVAVTLLGAPLAVEAQQHNLARVGFLSQGAAPSSSITSSSIIGPLFKMFREGLGESGYVEGQNLTIDHRFAEGRTERLPALVAELIKLRAEVIVVTGPAALRAARAATTTVPIVAIDLESDPVASGFAASLARPGGNITGTFLDQADLSGKWLELLKLAIPKLSRVAALWDSTTPSDQLNALKAGAQALAVTLQTVEIREAEDLQGAFTAAARNHAQGMVILSSPLTSRSGARLAGLAVMNRLPTISMFRENALAGCLMTYGPSLADGYRRVGSFAGKILRGTKPGELPIERPTKFELVINLKTAKALGLTIPPSLLLRADEVIQ